MKILFLILISINLIADSYSDGKKAYLEKSCGNCHGAKLEGLHKYPYLANRQKGFLMYKLNRFRNHHADNQQQEMMVPFALKLSDKEIDDLTTYMYEYVEETNAKSYDDSYQNYGDGGS